MNIGTSAISTSSTVNSLPGFQPSTQSARSQTPSPKEDNVQLSPAAQQALASPSFNGISTAQPSTLDQVIQLAAAGDIAALAQLALI